MPVELWFPTHIYYSQLEGEQLDIIHAELAQVFSKLKENNSFGQAPGWGSKTHKVSDPTFASNIIDDHKLFVFKNEIIHHVNKYILSLGSQKEHKFKILASWFTETNPGEYTRVHNHGSSDISGVYYFKTNEKDGSITFMSPSQQLPAIIFEKQKDTVTYNPKVGKLILFPGHLYHTVNENETSDDRISVSFNIYFER
jgi:uncharacterized protein (TIGR02466 family)